MAARRARLHALMFDRTFSFEDRARIIAGPLAPLAASLKADLDRLLPDEDVFIPPEKARMTRKGGRCEQDGALLEFDPRSPRQHRCPACGRVFDAEEHYRWWIMGYQLWLSERAVHAAALFRLGAGARYGALAGSILDRYADRYLAWPNEDNVLGPTRVFFSTYLESIWLLQLTTAVSILEHGMDGTVGARFRDRVAGPSAELILQFDEGLSNRQVWNSAAIGAAGMLVGRMDWIERALAGPGGLAGLIGSALFEDGTWYEGENYHLFAHRGLWYLVRLAEAISESPGNALSRFERGFEAPLRTALPDFTFPARRDSQYRASLRQWRIAESLELGLARAPDSAMLAAGLHSLYAGGPPGDAARWRSTGETERNVPAARLTRADLGWKALLFARADLPAPAEIEWHSALMEAQGFGVIRRDRGQTYAALDYGHAGGSHGHPDRLNLWLVLGDRRVFEDVGTGSYVERTLHWYRSTLAHNAPLIDGKSQQRVDGILRAWDERGEYSWIDAQAAIAPGVLVRRSVVVGPEYIIDRVQWNASRDVTFDLPFHVDAELAGAQWEPGTLKGGSGVEDGFEFITSSEKARLHGDPIRVEAAEVRGGVTVEAEHEWWRVTAPGPPGSDTRRFLLVRARGTAGTLTGVWWWADGFGIESSGPREIRVDRRGRKDTHHAGDIWRIELAAADTIVLDGRRTPPPASASPALGTGGTPRTVPLLAQPDVAIGELTAARTGLRFDLGQAHYMRTEATWLEAGSPQAVVHVAATEADLLVEITVQARDPNFSPSLAENPLDNEHPDVNSDGAQLHLSWLDAGGAQRSGSWLMVPESGALTPRVTARGDAADIPILVEWGSLSAGWCLLARVLRSALGPAGTRIGLDVIVNEMPRGRERRRGQLVMSATSPGWAYLRGDRQDDKNLIPMIVQHG